MPTPIEVPTLLVGPEQPQTTKTFARPFKLVFDTEDGKTTFIEVKTLRGLKEVMRRLGEGEIVVQSGFTLEIQLWGHLAEYCGFLRAKDSSDGLQPLGEGLAELAEDLSPLFGGEAGMLDALNQSKELIRRQRCLRGEDNENTDNDKNENSVLKPDGVNLTVEGEKKLAEIVGEASDELARAQDDGVQLYMETKAEELDVDTQIKVLSDDFEGKIITGPEAEEIGKRVEEAGEGKIAD